MASNHVAFVTAGGLTNATVAHSLYGYCTTGASTVAKTVTMYKTGSTAGASWAAGDLVHGLTITVRFQYSNTAANPTLNVNSTGAKPIYKYGTTVPGTTVDTSWPAQAVVQLTYDTLLNTSGCWVMNDHIDNTTYSSLTAASGGTDVSLVTTGEKYTWNNKSSTDEKLKQENSTAANAYRVLLSHSANDTTETNTSYKSTNLKFTPSTGNLQTTQLNGVTVGSSPKFSDTVTTVTASGSGNVVTGMTASNGAITYTMGTVSTTAAQIVRW